MVVSHYHVYAYPVFFSGPLGGEISPLSFEFPPQTITNFVCFVDIFHIFLSPQKQFPPQNYISRKNPALILASYFLYLDARPLLTAFDPVADSTLRRSDED